MVKIIIVEDDIKLNHLIKTILERNSFYVDSRSDFFISLLICFYFIFMIK